MTYASETEMPLEIRVSLGDWQLEAGDPRRIFATSFGVNEFVVGEAAIMRAAFYEVWQLSLAGEHDTGHTVGVYALGAALVRRYCEVGYSARRTAPNDPDYSQLGDQAMYGIAGALSPRLLNFLELYKEQDNHCHEALLVCARQAFRWGVNSSAPDEMKS